MSHVIWRGHSSVFHAITNNLKTKRSGGCSGARMIGAIDFAAINDAALSRGRSLVENLVPGGKFHGHEYVVRNPRRDDRNPGSFSINWKSGVWKDFATGDGGGDFVSLGAFLWGGGQDDAAASWPTCSAYRRQSRI